MARQRFTAWNPGASSLAVIEQADAICREYDRQGYDLTLRQLYYQFVARGLVANTQQSYKRIGDIVNNGRLAGLLDWDHIIDRTRNLSSPNHWDSPTQIVEAIASQYRIDKRADQEVRVEVWVEKEALAGVVQRAARGADVAHFSCRGYVSQSELYNAGQRFQAYIESGQKVVVVHLGDHDPSGLDMTRDITTRVGRFLTVGLGLVDEWDAPDPDYEASLLGPDARDGEFDLFEDAPWFQVRRIALNWDQVQAYNPPPNPAKMTDSRAGDYVARYGHESWELDALDPAVLNTLITDEVAYWTDPARFDGLRRRERTERAQLVAVKDNWDRIVEEYA